MLDKRGLTEDERLSRPVEFLVDKRLEFISRGTALQVLKVIIYCDSFCTVLMLLAMTHCPVAN